MKANTKLGTGWMTWQNYTAHQVYMMHYPIYPGFRTI